jgi:hypothetical protein
VKNIKTLNNNESCIDKYYLYHYYIVFFYEYFCIKISRLRGIALLHVYRNKVKALYLKLCCSVNRQFVIN